MLINEIKLRELIRKRILSEQAAGAALGAGVGALAAKAAGAGLASGGAAGVFLPLAVGKFLQSLELPASSEIDKILEWKTGGQNFTDELVKIFEEAGLKVELQPRQDHEANAKKLYDATKGGLTGIGTDEAAIQEVFSEFREKFSLLDAGYTAKIFWERHAKSGSGPLSYLGGTSGMGVGSQLSLYEVLQDELTDDDYDKFVRYYMLSSSKEPRPNSTPLAIVTGEDGETIDIYLDQLQDLKDGKIKPPEKEIQKIDINTLTGSIIKKVEYVLDRYDEDKIGNENEFEADDNWAADTDSIYLKVVNHGFDNHSTFKTLGNAQEYAGADLDQLKWKSILSPYLVGEGFPGYTGGLEGLLNFLVDLYNDETTLGRKSGGGGGGGGGRTKKKNNGSEENIEEPSAGGSKSASDISISVVGAPEGDRLEDFGGSTSELSQVIIDKLKGKNFSGDTMNLTVVLKKGKPVNVKKARGQKRTSAFENIKMPILNYLKRINFESSSSDKRRRISARKSVELVIRMPAGRY